MSYAAILADSSASEAGEDRLRLAAQVANRFGAVLIGLRAASAEPQLAEASEEARCAARQRCDSIASHAVAGREWRTAPTRSSGLIGQSRAVDLLVMDAGDGMVGDVVMRSGRPVLLVPADQDALEPCRVLVAWKDTRECRRAVSDAIPFLQQAMRVRLVEVCDATQAAQSELALADVAAWLARHGVTADWKVLSGPEADAPDLLRELCTAWEADLLVAGAYGHDRVREWLFGGVTRELLSVWPSAVLLSH